MEKITVTEALKQGYTLCGYDGLEMQNLLKIDQLEEDSFEPYHGRKLLVADRIPQQVSVSTKEIREWLIDRYFDTDGNPDDDIKDIELWFKEQEVVITEFASKMNEVYAKSNGFIYAVN